MSTATPSTIEFAPDRVQSALTSTFRELVFLTPSTTPATLFDALRNHFPHLDPHTWGPRICEGGLYLNGVCVREDCQLPVPCRIEYFEVKSGVDLVWADVTNNTSRFVVFEDEELLVFFKPAGLPSMPTREQRTRNLKTLLERYVQSKDPACALHMPSRIDTSVCGLVLASKRPSMHKALQRIFERREIQKTYLLGTHAQVDWQELEATGRIDRDPRHPILRRVVTNGGKSAHTVFSLLSQNDRGSLIAARLITGRTHQIRVHAASYGFPIRGDNFYSGAEGQSLELMSTRLQFRHPHTHQEVLVVTPPALMPVWLPEKALALLPELA